MLFRRLFFQKCETDTTLINSVEIRSLLCSFDFEETSEGAELEILAGIAEVSESKLFGMWVSLRIKELLEFPKAEELRGSDDDKRDNERFE